MRQIKLFFEKFIVQIIILLIAGIIILFIQYSYFEKSKVEQKFSLSDEITKSWNGIWIDESPNYFKTITSGTIIITVKGENVSGSFRNNTPSRGTIKGIIDKTGMNISGKWENSIGEKGSFIFYLDPNKRSFKGFYSMGDNIAGRNPNNYWNGTKYP
jgi:hypothetical protein